MKTISEKHPILFTILLFIIALIAVVPFSVFSPAAWPADFSISIGRILVAIVLLFLFRSCIRKENSFSAVRLLPVPLLIPLWNIAYHFLTNCGQLVPIGSPIIIAFVCALAPALFEETIFRAIQIDKLKRSGKAPMTVLLISSAVFAAVHLTNIAGMTLINVLIQVAYAFVIGFLLGAIYIRTEDFATVVLIHFLIDFSNQIFANSPAASPVYVIPVFLVILTVETWWAWNYFQNH